MADEITGLTWFDGAASGQQRSALMRLQPSHLMISYATQNNTPWDNRYQSRDEYTLFVDSGGYHHMSPQSTGDGEYETTDEEYLDYIEEHEPALWALRDYPCEEDILKEYGRTVEDHQRMTTERAKNLLSMAEDRGTPGQPVTVIQGYNTQQYLEHYDTLCDEGLLTGYCGIGTLCGREDVEEIASVVNAVRDELGNGPGLHGFGLDKTALAYEEVVGPLTSADSCAYDFEYSQHGLAGDRDEGESFTWRDSARSFLNWRWDLSRKINTKSLYGTTMQTTLSTKAAATDGGAEK